MEVRKSLAVLPGEVSVNGEVARVQLGSDGWKRCAGWMGGGISLTPVGRLGRRMRKRHGELEGQERTGERF